MSNLYVVGVDEESVRRNFRILWPLNSPVEARARIQPDSKLRIFRVVFEEVAIEDPAPPAPGGKEVTKRAELKLENDDLREAIESAYNALSDAYEPESSRKTLCSAMNEAMDILSDALKFAKQTGQAIDLDDGEDEDDEDEEEESELSAVSAPEADPTKPLGTETPAPTNLYQEPGIYSSTSTEQACSNKKEGTE